MMDKKSEMSLNSLYLSWNMGRNSGHGFRCLDYTESGMRYRRSKMISSQTGDVDAAAGTAIRSNMSSTYTVKSWQLLGVIANSLGVWLDPKPVGWFQKLQPTASSLLATSQQLCGSNPWSYRMTSEKSQFCMCQWMTQNWPYEDKARFSMRTDRTQVQIHQ